MYNTKPRFLETIFFPDTKSLDRVIHYIGRAKKSLKICVFTISHDSLAQAILDRFKAGVDVKVITDDECMKN